MLGHRASKPALGCPLQTSDYMRRIPTAAGLGLAPATPSELISDFCYSGWQHLRKLMTFHSSLPLSSLLGATSKEQGWSCRPGREVQRSQDLLHSRGQQWVDRGPLSSEWPVDHSTELRSPVSFLSLTDELPAPGPVVLPERTARGWSAAGRQV